GEGHDRGSRARARLAAHRGGSGATGHPPAVRSGRRGGRAPVDGAEQPHRQDPARRRKDDLMSENPPQSEATDQAGQDAPDRPQDQSGRRVVVVTQDGMGVAPPADGTESAEGQGDPKRKPTELVEQPAKVMRLGTMIKQLLEEVKEAPLDEAGRARLAEIHRRSLTELEQGLAPELVEELERITLPLSEGAPSEAELRIAQAQLVGWLEGLFHGIQTAIVAQQMA